MVSLCRALGDIGNLVGPFNSRCNVGKENAGAKNEPAAKQVLHSVKDLSLFHIESSEDILLPTRFCAESLLMMEMSNT